jgi:PadR family transcriptional regulator PadR
MSTERQVLRNLLNMLVLAVLHRGALHGYAIRDALRQGSSGRFDISEGTVYPALQRLEHLGLVSSSWAVVDRRHIRVYELTPAGRDKLSADCLAWQDFVAAVGTLLEPQLEASAKVTREARHAPCGDG